MDRGAGRCLGPVQPLGTYGTITTRKNGPVYYAATRYRGFDGAYHRLQASGATRRAAVDGLKSKIANWVDTAPGDDLTGQAKLSEVADLWLDEIALRDRIAPQTVDKYRDGVNDIVLPALGNLRLAELSVGTLDRFFKALAATALSRARLARVVLAQILDLAVRHDALVVNPVRATAPIAKPRSTPRALSLDELAHIRRIIAEWRTDDGTPGPKPDSQLPLIFDVILGTSARIGEALAIRVCDVNLTTSPATVTISGTVLRRKTDGLIRQDHPKHSKRWRVVAIPAFTATAIRQRLVSLGDEVHPEQTIFCTKYGSPLAPANVRRIWRDIRNAHADDLPPGVDLSDVTPHTFRKTVATILDQAADGGTELAAELLGHHSTTVTEQHYIQPTKTVNPVTATILEHLGPRTP